MAALWMLLGEVAKDKGEKLKADRVALEADASYAAEPFITSKISTSAIRAALEADAWAHDLSAEVAGRQVQAAADATCQTALEVSAAEAALQAAGAPSSSGDRHSRSPTRFGAPSI